MASGPITLWQIDGETMETVTDYFLGLQKSLLMVTAAMKLEDTCSLEESSDNLDSVLKSRDITLPTEVCIVKAMVYPVVMYGCESWTIKKNWCFWTVVLEKTLESPLDCREIKQVIPKGNQPHVFIGRFDTEWSSNTLAT